MAETSGGSGPTGTTTSRRLAKRVRGSPTGNTPHHPQKRSSIRNRAPVSRRKLFGEGESTMQSTGKVKVRQEWTVKEEMEDRFWGWCEVDNNTDVANGAPETDSGD